MAWTYVELFRKADPSTLVGHFVRIFDEGVVPPIPDDKSRLVRIEVANRTTAQVRAFLGQGIGRIKLGSLPANVRQQLRDTRTFSGPASAFSGALGVDRDPAALPVGTRKVRQKKDSPSKPAGTIWYRDSSDPVPRFRCLTDDLTWMDEVMVDDDIAQQGTINGTFPFHFEEMA